MQQERNAEGKFEASSAWIVRALSLAAVAAISLVAAGTAQANPGFTAAEDVGIAEAFWNSPITGCYSITFGTMPLPGNGGEATQPLPGTAVACVIEVHEVEAPIYSPEFVCEAMIHEFGHLHGLGHVTDPSSIMYGGVLGPAELVAPPCAGEPVPEPIVAPSVAGSPPATETPPAVEAPEAPQPTGGAYRAADRPPHHKHQRRHRHLHRRRNRRR